MNWQRIGREAAKTVAVLLIIFGVLRFALERSEPYKLALAYIRANDTIREQLGAVQKADIGLSGRSQSSYGSSSGYAEYRINVVGEKDKAVAHLKLIKTGGSWFVESAELIMADGKIVQLSSTSATGQASP